DDLDELLPRRYGVEYPLARRLLLHPIREVARHLIVHVGIQQRPTNLAHRLGDVEFVDATLAGDGLECAFYFFGDTLEHARAVRCLGDDEAAGAGTKKLSHARSSESLTGPPAAHTRK